jgi:hypothetical protein
LTRFSGRFWPALIAIFILTLVPILHGRMVPARDECSSDEALFDQAALYPEIELVVKGPRSSSPERRRMTGIVARDEPSRRLLFTITRTFGLPNGLVQPAAALPGEHEPDVVESASVVVDGLTIPIHYASERVSGFVQTTAYFMTYRGKPISSPMLVRLRGAPAALVASRWPISLFVVTSRAHTRNLENLKPRLDDWIRAAWTHYAQVCPEPPSEEIWSL